MGFLRWLLEGGKKVARVEQSPEQSSGFYVPDTRTPEEHAALKKKYLHPNAEAVASGVCAVGQADNEKSFGDFKDSINIKGVRYVATLDNACCPQCWPLDGVVFPADIGKRPPIPRHENCRCLYLMETKTWKDFGIDLEDLEKVKRPWVLADYQYAYKKDPTKKLKKPRRIIRNFGHFQGNAEQWIRSLPKKEQRQFFATDLAYCLWSEEKIRAIDMLNTETWELLNDADLRQMFL